MKALPSIISALLSRTSSRMNILALVRFVAFLAVLITAYSVIFHVLMAAEGQQHSWMTGFYWTLTVMSTLGFGDITFHSDLGRLFSMLVLVSGVVFLLVLMPFTVIKFFWAPWVEAQERSRTPRQLPPETSDHVIITGHGPVDMALARKLRNRRTDYVIVVGGVPADATALGQVFWYTLEGRDGDGNPTGGWDLHELRSIQDWTVRYALQSAEGVSEVASVGGFVREYQIDVDPDAMRAYGVTLPQVYNAVRKSNVDVGARTIECAHATN